MRTLVLGGGRFVGFHIAATAAAKGWPVTVFNHDPVPPGLPDVRWWKGDRDRAADIQQLGETTWDLVVDTWTGPPSAVLASLAALGNRTGRYCYISSVAAGAASTGTRHYAGRKRAAELAVLASDIRGLAIRLGLVLGPREHVGRLAYWLRALAQDRPVLAPGQPGRPLRYVDVREAAETVLTAAVTDVSGLRTITRGPSGAATMGALLEAAARAVGRTRPVSWVPDDVLRRAGVRPWTGIPLWIPESGMEFDAYAQEGDLLPALPGMSSASTVSATLTWLQEPGANDLLEDRKWVTAQQIEAIAYSR